MRIEIDQSGKIENTEKPTVLAFSNSISNAIIISGKEKRKLQNYFRKTGKSRLFILLTFSALVFLLLKRYIKNCRQIVVDREYPGYEKFITQKLREFILDDSKTSNFRIHTSEIGRKSQAHILAYSVYKKKRLARKAKAEEIIKIIEKNKKSGST